MRCMHMQIASLCCGFPVITKRGHTGSCDHWPLQSCVAIGLSWPHAACIAKVEPYGSSFLLCMGLYDMHVDVHVYYKPSLFDRLQHLTSVIHMGWSWFLFIIKHEDSGIIFGNVFWLVAVVFSVWFATHSQLIRTTQATVATQWICCMHTGIIIMDMQQMFLCVVVQIL